MSLKNKTEEELIEIRKFLIEETESDIKEIDKELELRKSDWRDAFVEEFYNLQKTRFAGKGVLEVTYSNDCSYFKPLLDYISKFKRGGFWYTKDEMLFFVIKGTQPTYKNAKNFLKNWGNE